MAINPNIPLQVQTPRIGEGIVQLANLQRQKTADRENRQDRSQQRDLRDLQIRQAEEKLSEFEQQAPTRRMQQFSTAQEAQLKTELPVALDTVSLLGRGDIQGTQQRLLQHKQELEQAGLDTSEVDQDLQTLQENPRALLEGSIQLVQTGQQFGLIETPERQASTLSSEQKQQLGLPEEAVVQQNTDGALKIVFNPEEDSDQRSRKIQNLVQQGLPENEAANIVDGITDIEIVPETGRARLINKKDNSVREIPISGEDNGRADVAPDETLFNLVNDATGLRSGVLATTARIPGTEVSESEKKVLNARNQFQLFQNEVARGLVNNSKFPVKEREAVLDAIDISPSLFDNPSAMKVRLKSSKNFLRTKLEQAERDENDPSLPEKTRSDQASNASVLRNALDRIGEQDVNINEELGKMGRDEIRQLVRDMSDEELDSLSESEREAIAKALK